MPTLTHGNIIQRANPLFVGGAVLTKFQLSEKTGYSHTSISKCMNHLVGEKELYSLVCYTKLGRPIKAYSRNSRNLQSFVDKENIDHCYYLLLSLFTEKRLTITKKRMITLLKIKRLREIPENIIDRSLKKLVVDEKLNKVSDEGEGEYRKGNLMSLSQAFARGLKIRQTDVYA